MILEEILAHKKEEVRRLKGEHEVSELRSRARDLPPTCPFRAALSQPGRMRLIAEIKKASPSGGLLREEFDPSSFASIYERAGAAAVSVLTDERYFGGKPSDLQRARRSCALPILRKDFVIDPYQVYQSRLVGADAILLIVRALKIDQLKELHELAGELGMDSLVEVHNREELESARQTGADLIGINNRDLDTLTVDLDTTIRLRPLVPQAVVVVSESGIKTAQAIDRLKSAGVDAVLVGEAFMKSKDIGQTVRQFLTWMES